MEEVTPPKEYTYTLKAEDFKELFLASDEDFEELKGKNLQAKGIKQEGRVISIEDTEIVGTIPIVNQDPQRCRSLFFNNVKMGYFEFIRSDLPLVRDDIRAAFDFKGCDIKCILISTATIGDLRIDEKSHIGSIEISKSKVEQIHFGTSKINSFRINLESSITCLQIQESITDDLFLSNSEIDSIEIKDSSTSEISIHESQINKKFNINLSGTGNIRLTNSIIHNFSTENCLTGDIILSDVKVDVFHVKNNYCSFNFGKTLISDFQLSQCKVPTIRIDSACDINGYITNVYFNLIDFRNTTIRTGSILSISYSQIFSILTECFTMLGNLSFRKITKADKVFEYPTFDQIQYLNLGGGLAKKIEEHRKEQYLKLKKAYGEESTNLSVKKPTIRFQLTSLGKTEFIDCPLGDYSLEFNNSKITDCFVSGNSIPNNVQIVKALNFSIIEETDSLTCHQQKASFYNQLKKIFEAQGDIYHATQFQAKWSEEERKYLKLQRRREISGIGFSTFYIALNKFISWISSCIKFIFKPLSLLCRNIEKTNFWKRVKIYFNPTSNDIFTLWLNKISNLHGESWVRTLGVFFLLIVPFIYLLFLWRIGRAFTSTEFDCNLIWKYFEFLNPAHNKFIDATKEVNGIAILIDFVGRVFVAYGIYQFIAAFRKHTKKQ